MTFNACCKETSKKVRFADKARNPEQWVKDRALRIKVCWLVAAEIMPEAWLRDATEAVLRRTRKKGRDAAYWYTCLEEGAAKRGKDLGQLLATCGQAIPPEVLAGDTSNPTGNNEPAHQDCARLRSRGPGRSARPARHGSTAKSVWAGLAGWQDRQEGKAKRGE